MNRLVLDRDFKPPLVNVPAKTNFFALCEILMKPPAPASLRTEAADIDVACGVGLRHPETGQIQTAAVVEIELLVLMNHRTGLSAVPKSSPPCGIPPMMPGSAVSVRY